MRLKSFGVSMAPRQNVFSHSRVRRSTSLRVAPLLRNLSVLRITALRSILATTLTALLFFGASSCAVPIAPAYRIVKESREVTFIPGPPPELEIQARYVLQNSGNRVLQFVDVIFPDAKLYGRTKLHAEVDGREAALSSLPAAYQEETPDALRIAMDQPWLQKQTRALVITYSFSSPEDLGSRITLGEASFHLGSRGWFPLPQPPKHMLAPYPRRPEKTSYSIRVPADFLLLARGRQVSRKQESGEVDYTFQLSNGDLAPYIVAGRYAEAASHQKASRAAFWTLQPLTEDTAIAGERIAAAWVILQTDFGSLDKNIQVPHVVESPELRAHVTGETGAAFESFPGGVLVNRDALALGISSEAFLAKTTHALAHNWFGDEMYPMRDAAVGIGEGLPDYATIVIDEARGGESARRQRIIKFMQEYDDARKEAAEKPLAVTVLTDLPEQRRISLAKAPLFFAALEDECGESPIRGGLARIVSLLRGREVGYDDLRAALEQSTGKNLAETFRVWLNEKGIPANFRDRYSDRPEK